MQQMQEQEDPKWQGLPKDYENWWKLGFEHISKSTFKAIKEVKAAQKGERIVFPTKFPRLNRQLMGGLTPGKLLIISGRPGSGKSMFSNQMIFDVLDLAAKANRKVIVLYWSFEMPGSEQVIRSASKDTGLNMLDLYSIDKTLADRDLIRFTKAVYQYKKYPIYFQNTSKSITFVQTRVHKIQELFPEYQIINLFDHSRLFDPEQEKSELERLVNISHGCMKMQSETRCINIILSQLNRNIEREHRAKQQYQPLLSDLFGSDSLGQDAQVVMMINRPYDMYGITDQYCGEDPKNLLALHIEKNRTGQLGMIPFETNMKNFSIKERTSYQKVA